MNRVSIRESREGAAFTLIEILTVVGILAVLAALLLPALASVKQHRWQTQCFSHLRQIGTATILAAADNSGRFPDMCEYSWDPNYGHFSPPRTVGQVLAPYLNYTYVSGHMPEILRCPAAEANPASTMAYLKAAGYDHYAYNTQYAPNRMPTVGATSAMLFYDTVFGNTPTSAWAHWAGPHAVISVGYADGHVEPVTYAEFQALMPGTTNSKNPFFESGWIQ